MGTGVATPRPGDERPGNLLTRREMLRRTAIAVAGLAVAPVALSACTGTKSESPAPTPETSAAAPTPPAPTSSAIPASASASAGSLRIGVGAGPFSGNWGGEALAGLSDANVAFAARQGAVTFALDTSPVNEGTDYFAGTPPDVVAYYGSYQLRRFGRQELLTPLDDVWSDVKGNYPSTVGEVLAAADGHVYGLPFEFFSTVFFYRKSVFAAKGYQVPSTWSDLLALCSRMKADGLAPIALGNRDLWPQLFLFDMLDLRLNGYAFNAGLLAGREKWTDPRVLEVFETWRKLIPYYPPDYTTATWQDAAAKFVAKQAGMYFIGSYAVDQFEDLDGSILDDLDAFEFPYFGNEWDEERSLLAGMDVWVIPSRSSGAQANRPTAKAYLEHWANGSTQLLPQRHLHGYVPMAKDIDPTQLAAPTRTIHELMGKAAHLVEGVDRSVGDGFPPELWNYLREFAAKPSTNLGEMLRNIQQFWDDLPPDKVEPPPKP